MIHFASSETDGGTVARQPQGVAAALTSGASGDHGDFAGQRAHAVTPVVGKMSGSRVAIPMVTLCRAAIRGVLRPTHPDGHGAAEAVSTSTESELLDELTTFVMRGVFGQLPAG